MQGWHKDKIQFYLCDKGKQHLAPPHSMTVMLRHIVNQH